MSVDVLASFNGGYFRKASINEVLDSSEPVLYTPSIELTAAPVPVWYSATNASGSMTSGGTQDFYQWVVQSDVVDCTTHGGPPGCTGFAIYHHIGGPTMTGGRNAFTATLYVDAASNPASPASRYYVGGAFAVTASANDGGVQGNGLGAAYGGVIAATLNPAATYWNELIGLEIDTVAAHGTQAISYKYALKIIQQQQDAVAGTVGNSAINISASAGNPNPVPGWSYGIQFGAYEGWWPIAPAGTIIGTAPSAMPGGPSYAAANGVDLSAVTISGAAFKSSGFAVDGAGATTVKRLKITDLDTIDPHDAGALWLDNGVLKVSAG